MPLPPTDQPPKGFDEQLAAAYAAADYRVNAFTLHIGRPHPAFDAWLLQQGRTRYTLLTAFYPKSKVLTAEENRVRHETLVQLLRFRQYAYVDAVSTDPGGHWPDEEGVCLFDLPEGEARALGRIYEQHALVEGSTGGTPLLHWL